jgi:2-polyprenyl-3-methyl-5-hydroxy-6-metoxy-1,4-benzoquinol methylase
MDREAVMVALDHVVEMLGGALTLGALAVADRTGLLQSMAGRTGATDAELAASTGLEERYVREILATLTAGQVVSHDRAAGTFALTEEYAAVLADPTSPYSMAGWLDMLPAVMEHIPEVAEAAQSGGGVSFEAFGPDLVRGIDRSNSPSTRILLTRRWLGAVDGLTDRLVTGINIADVGCGSGTAVLTMGAAYPESTVVGYDVHPDSIARARAKAADAGLDNVSFEVVGANGIPEGDPLDLVTCLDVVHDLAEPLAVLRSIRRRLTDDGLFFMMEPRMAHDVADNIGPRPAMLYGISLLHCLTQSLAQGGAGLGAGWGPRRAEALVREAGFGSFEELPVDNPFSAFYAVRT